VLFSGGLRLSLLPPALGDAPVVHNCCEVTRLCYAEPMNIVEILERHAGERPQAPAIVERDWFGRDRVTTFGGLHSAVARAATLLWQSGLRPGDAVLVFQPMTAELYVALIAIFRLNLIAMFLDPSAGRDHMERCCSLQPPKALIATTRAHWLRLWSPALQRIPIKFNIGSCPVPGARRWGSYAALAPHPEVLPCEPDSPALLTFTSGSTGQPKAALRTHGFLLAQHRALEQSLELRPGEIDLTTLPIFLLANLGSGVTSVIPDADLRYPGAVDPRRVVVQIQKHQTLSSTASPAFFERLARHCLANGVTLPSFRKLFTGGAPVFPRLLDQMQTMSPQAAVVSVYGSTEAEPMSHVARHEMTPGDRDATLGGGGLLVGRPVPGLQLRVVRDQWGTPLGPYSQADLAATCVAAGQPGEIVVSGGHVLSGYLHGRGDEETKFRVDGVPWHRTGDAGRLDDQGRLWLLGRCSARIKDEHGVLYPFAVEAAAYADPRIKRAAVVGKTGRRMLVLEPYEKHAPPDLAGLARRLNWAHVADYRFRDRIPVDKRHNAKVDYPALQQLLQRGE
jgi:acyl-CoA synthetase (AMP-forming)/AMP-acid ligase II